MKEVVTTSCIEEILHELNLQIQVYNILNIAINLFKYSL
jgi:hypothetical protein